jgi:hypothetical protein
MADSINQSLSDFTWSCYFNFYGVWDRIVIFWLMLSAMIVMTATQDVLYMGVWEKLEMPQPGQNYGTQIKEVPAVLMPAATQSLYDAFCVNSYSCSSA